MHDYLFEHQRALDDAHLVQYAVALNLDKETFKREMTDMTNKETFKREMTDMTKGVGVLMPVYLLHFRGRRPSVRPRGCRARRK